MGIIDKAKFAAFNTSVTTAWNKAFADAPKPYKLFAMETESKAASEDYAWLGDIPSVKEWVSDRTFESLKGFTYEIKNKSWEAGFQVDRDDVEDDRLGLYAPKVQDLALAPSRHYMKLIVDLILGGFTGLCWDGQFFFDTDHAFGSNKATATLASAGALDNAIAAMMQYKNDEGTEYIDVTPSHLVVPPQLRATAKALVEAEVAANGASNTNYKALQVYVEPRLAASPTAWFVLDLTKPLKPFILQLRRAFQLISFDDERVHEAAFMRKKFRYSIDGRDNAGYGLPQLAWGSTGAG